MNARSILRSGSIAGLINLFIVLLGLNDLAGRLVMAWLGLPSQEPGAWLFLLAVALGGGVVAVRRAGCASWLRIVAAGLLAGAPHGLLLAAFTWLLGHLMALGPAANESPLWRVLAHLVFRLDKITPETVRLLTLGRSPLVAASVTFGALMAASLAGAAWAQVSVRYRWSAGLKKRWATWRAALPDVPVALETGRLKHWRRLAYGLGLLALLVLPLMLDQYWNYMLGTVGIYVILGLGLNVVVGMAGLLDIGYVAFFAVGGYTIALLTAPTPHGVMLDFWLVLPLGIALAAVVGVLLGIPALGVRGDYLAMVTLAFGEIISILLRSILLQDFTGGPRGVRNVSGPSLFGHDLSSELHFMYLIILGIILTVWITSRLQNSRVGRAWLAIREDEDVAAAMGVNTLKYKLLAFATGAATAGFAGVIFASRNKFAGPEDFSLIVSVNVVCLVIVGGMGSIPGVVLGALVLKGLPEILRELDNYRMLAFGALLIVMMLVRPEGLWPSTRRKMELHEHHD